MIFRDANSVCCLLYMLHHLGDKFTKRASRDSLCYPELKWVIDWWLLWVCFHVYNVKTFLPEAFKSLTRYFTCCFEGWCHFPIFDNHWDTTKKGGFRSESALSQNWKFTLFNSTEHPNFCGYFSSEPPGVLDLILSLPIFLARSAVLWACELLGGDPDATIATYSVISASCGLCWAAGTCSSGCHDTLPVLRQLVPHPETSGRLLYLSPLLQGPLSPPQPRISLTSSFPSPCSAITTAASPLLDTWKHLTIKLPCVKTKTARRIKKKKNQPNKQPKKPPKTKKTKPKQTQKPKNIPTKTNKNTK